MAHPLRKWLGNTIDNEHYAGPSEWFHHWFTAEAFLDAFLGELDCALTRPILNSIGRRAAIEGLFNGMLISANGEAGHDRLGLDLMGGAPDVLSPYLERLTLALWDLDTGDCLFSAEIDL